MNKRIEYIDSIKGLACILMVVGHVIAWQFYDYSKVVHFNIEQDASCWRAGFIWQIIYSFHMALFFMVSGYFCYKKSGRSLSKMFVDKTKRLLIPYICTGFLLLLVRDHYGYWFLFSLYEILIIGYIIQKIMDYINKKNYIVLDILLILVANYILTKLLYHPSLQNSFVDFGYGTTFFLPFMMGFLMHKYPVISFYLYKSPFILITIFCILFFSRYMTGQNLLLRGIRFIAYHSEHYHLISIVGSLIAIIFVKNIKNATINFMLRFIGKFTFEIYVLHVFFVIEFKAVGNFWLTNNIQTVMASQLIYSIIVGGIAIGISIVVYKLLSQSKICSALLFGRWERFDKQIL